ncbi:MAG TPA: hypothetical protein VNY73_04185 [Bacteroidia bacterium]|nr:hypothetical protein [Bacteroidia bacterium]
MSSKKGNRSDVHKDLFDINKLSELKNYPTSLWKMKSNDFEDLFKHGWEATNATLKFNSPSIMKKNN